LPEPGWYYRLSQFFREKFGEKVFKIPVHAGFTCPNRDGTISRRGCVYCYNPSFSPEAGRAEVEEKRETIKNQVHRFQARKEKTSLPTGSVYASHSLPRRKYLVYFQSYTNTYGDNTLLESLYREALQIPGVVGMSVATRPDCLSSETLRLLTCFAREYHVWVELGLQSAFDHTLNRINRGHTFKQFQDAVSQLADCGVWQCVHLINGLPGEDKAMMLETAQSLNSMPVHGVKFHQLQVLKHTPLEEMYYQNQINPLHLEDYLDIICSQLELLRRDLIVHRLLSETAQPALLLAPCWEGGRGQFAQMVESRLRVRESYQGKKAAGL